MNDSTLLRPTRFARWISLLIAPPLLALMAWAGREVLRNHASHEVASQLWSTGLAFVLIGGVSLSLLAALFWAFRAYVYVDDDMMIVHGIFRRTVIRPEFLEGFRVINGQYHVYLKNRSAGIQIAYFECMWFIKEWIHQRTTDMDRQLLDEEADEISGDVSLGYMPDEKAKQLVFLNKLVNTANFLIYAAVVIAAVNFLFVENPQAEVVSVAVLTFGPLLLSLLALSHRGHIRIDHDEGSQYPQIFSGSLASGIALMLLAMLDRGALLNNDLYRLIAVGVLINGLLWWFIDQKRLKILLERGRGAMIMTVVSYFAISAPWVGGSLYHFNKLADLSAPVVYESTVIRKTRTSGKATRYSIDLEPWSGNLVEPVKITVRGREYDLFEAGMPVRLVVKAGALHTPWVADVQRASQKVPDLYPESTEPPESIAGAADLESFCDRLPRPAYADYRKHETSNDWFEVYEVETNIWAIYEPFQWQEVISYLIVGTESSLLFDTGNGIGDIKSVVDQLTDKPVRVLNSHSHFDHIGGNYQFDEILSVSTEFSLSRTDGIRSDELSLEVSPQALCNGLPAGVTRQDHRIKPFSISQTIADGEVLEIGGRTLEVLHVPGHTDDAIALLDRSAGYLWSGDSFYEGPIWLFAPETDLVAYQKSIAKLAALAPDLAAVFPAHNTPKTNPALLVHVHENLDQVLAGKIEPVPVADGNVEFQFERFGFLMRENYHGLKGVGSKSDPF